MAYSSALTGVPGLIDHAGLLPELPDGLQRAVQMRAGLGMDGDDVGPGLGEGLDDRDRRARSSGARRTAGSSAGASPDDVRAEA